MERTGIARYLVVSSAMLFPGGGAIVGLLRSITRNHLRDVRAMEDRFRQSELQWTFARPPRLVQTREEAYRELEDALPCGLTLRAALSWRAVAAFMLDCVQAGSHVRKVVGICR
jgi:hypothetical protein